jgi:CheY-like chemotaxis protein
MASQGVISTTLRFLDWIYESLPHPFPVTPPSSDDNSKASPDTFRSPISNVGNTKRILIVDDSDVVRDVVRTFLERSDFLVCEAANGAEAITKARASNPDLIVMDLVMPGMNGVEASSVIRNTMPNVPIIAFTMYDTLARSLTSSLAISSVVAKPDGLAKLGECIQDLLGPVS